MFECYLVYCQCNACYFSGTYSLKWKVVALSSIFTIELGYSGSQRSVYIRHYQTNNQGKHFANYVAVKSETSCDIMNKDEPVPSHLWDGSKLPALRPHGQAHCATSTNLIQRENSQKVFENMPNFTENSC